MKTYLKILFETILFLAYFELFRWVLVQEPLPIDTFSLSIVLIAPSLIIAMMMYVGNKFLTGMIFSLNLFAGASLMILFHGDVLTSSDFGDVHKIITLVLLFFFYFHSCWYYIKEKLDDSETNTFLGSVMNMLLLSLVQVSIIVGSLISLEYFLWSAI